MKATEKASGDRISIDERHHNLYQNLASGDRRTFATMKDVFVVAAALGQEAGEQKDLSSRKQIFDIGVLAADDLLILQAIAVASTGDIKVLEDPAAVLRIAEVYANAGIERLRRLESDSADQRLVSIATLLLRAAGEETPAMAAEISRVDASKGLAEMLKGGRESSSVEFKSSLRWDVRENRVNRDLQREIAKAVGGFMNTNGGTVVIGVDDSLNVLGIANDINSLGKKANLDGFELTVRQELGDRVGPEFSPFVSSEFEDTPEGHTVCLLRVRPAPKPVYMKDGQTKLFFVRDGNSTKPLDMQAAHEYISMHFR